ncbi:hypothetical protein M409DRAFT_20470 [Zasmidium cellare ATCC 36951]|uniref:Uncharacterized protein n=1 Tax=Zasmidium cellare ATCC 36951 TaxID=1080233 RepID=A0A6A6CUT1_ZASCE|nr:uncharacterized protein M409DRAFT_20470 [Zasmidium cellare ATCC 36951]KAF2169246.1 hypothetical protein M409DRAFT_20470 [Zasmidium cellare ATCC 36951]
MNSVVEDSALSSLFLCQIQPCVEHNALSNLSPGRLVSLQVYDTIDITRVEGEMTEEDFYLTVHLKVRGAGVVDVVVETGVLHPSHRLVWDPSRTRDIEQLRDIEGAIEKLSSIACGMAAKEGFKGFKMSDLEEMAAVFRFE